MLNLVLRMTGDCDDLHCYGCHSFECGADDRRRESVLFKGLSEVTQLEFSVDPKVVCASVNL